MATITELALFKECVENPKHIQRLEELNLDKISDPQNMADITEKVYYQKKALKLFHMTWSGVTKYMRTVCQVKNKPVSFPGLGIFVPMLKSEDVVSRQLTTKALEGLNPADLDVTLMVNQSFLSQCGGGVRISEKPEDLISLYDPIQGEGNISGMQHINLASIARVCDSDILSIELVIKEILAQIKHHLQKGSSLRLMFKIGKLISRGGELSWRSFREDSDRMNRTFHGDPTVGSQAGSTYSRAMVGSRYKKDFSVMTPSLTKTRANSQVTSELKSFHMANPNPQQHQVKFKGVRDLGYSAHEKLVDPTDIVKFGKKVNYESKMNNEQIMEEHLRQMREKMEQGKQTSDIKRKQEKEFLAHIKELEELEKQRQKFGKNAINQDFVYYNAKIQNENSEKQKQMMEKSKKDKYNYFPFVSGDLIEKHRASLGAQLKNDLQSYMDYQKKAKGSSSRQAGVDVFSNTYDTNSLKSGGFYQSGGRARAVKQLFDSEYVKPQDNFRVMQDSNPLKSAALKEALKRYEDNLKKENKHEGSHLKDHKHKVEYDENQLNQEKETKINKQKKFNQEIQEQMELNAQLRDHQKMISKLPISTGFTPETTMGEHASLMQKKLKQQDIIKTQLSNQMQRRQDLENAEKKQKIDHENLVNQQAKEGLEQLKERKKKEKELEKMLMQEELSRIQAIKMQKVAASH